MLWKSYSARMIRKLQALGAILNRSEPHSLVVPVENCIMVAHEDGAEHNSVDHKTIMDQAGLRAATSAWLGGEDLRILNRQMRAGRVPDAIAQPPPMGQSLQTLHLPTLHEIMVRLQHIISQLTLLVTKRQVQCLKFRVWIVIFCDGTRAGVLLCPLLEKVGDGRLFVSAVCGHRKRGVSFRTDMVRDEVVRVGVVERGGKH